MPYALSPEQVASITDVELAFGTERLLPAWDDIPQAFQDGNLYTRIMDALFAGVPLPICDIEFRDGFIAAQVVRAVRAHLSSFAPKHQHKIAGVAYLLSCAATVTLDEERDRA